MSFNPDPSKQAQEKIFSRKIKKPSNTQLKLHIKELLFKEEQQQSRFYRNRAHSNC